MKKVRRNLVKFVLLGIITVMCCSCGASLNSMKDANNYIKTSRVKELRGWGELAGAIQATSPKVKVQKSSPGSIALLGLGLLTASVPLDYIAAGIYTPTTLIGISEDLKNQPVTGNLMTIETSLRVNTAVLYRKEPGKPEWDLGQEAIKRAGKLPVRNAGCVIEKFEPRNSIFSTEYKGEDGEIELNRLVFPRLWVYGDYNTTPACTMEDLLTYKEYMTKLTMAMAQILKEETIKIDESILQEYPDIQNKTGNLRGKIYWYDSDTQKGFPEK